MVREAALGRRGWARPSDAAGSKETRPRSTASPLSPILRRMSLPGRDRDPTPGHCHEGFRTLPFADNASSARLASAHERTSDIVSSSPSYVHRQKHQRPIPCRLSGTPPATEPAPAAAPVSIPGLASPSTITPASAFAVTVTPASPHTGIAAMTSSPPPPSDATWRRGILAPARLTPPRREPVRGPKPTEPATANYPPD